MRSSIKTANIYKGIYSCTERAHVSRERIHFHFMMQVIIYTRDNRTSQISVFSTIQKLELRFLALRVHIHCTTFSIMVLLQNHRIMWQIAWSSGSDKTKLLLLGLRQILSTVPDNFSVTLLGKLLYPVQSAEDIGVTMDARLTFGEHLTNVVSSCTNCLCQINRAIIILACGKAYLKRT